MPSTQPTCLGYAETQFLSVTAVIADAMVKASDVTLLGLEPNGTEGICIRIGADTPAALQAALDKAETLAEELGSTASCESTPTKAKLLLSKLGMTGVRRHDLRSGTLIPQNYYLAALSESISPSPISTR